MATDVILPALGMAQDTGKIVQWLKAEGELVTKDEPLAEIETDKATVEIEAPADGVLARITAAAGADVPVGQVIATILAPGEVSQENVARTDEQRHSQNSARKTVRPQKAVTSPVAGSTLNGAVPPLAEATRPAAVAASPLASRIAAAHNLDLSLVQTAGKRVQKSDVVAYLQSQVAPAPTAGRLVMASPKARRLANEQGQDLAAIKGSGPEGAVLAADVLAAAAQMAFAPGTVAGGATQRETSAPLASDSTNLAPSNIWRIMAERTTQSWTSVPHFYLVREVNASRLISWREHILQRGAEKVTYTDLLVKIVAAALLLHPRLNASWQDGKIVLQREINVGLAVAINEGLVVPVIHQADKLGLHEIARQRQEMVARAQGGKLRPQDISNGTFTISNLGMYDVDAFNAIINQPQAAILAVGRIAERVVPVNGQPAVQPMMMLTLSCDHRVIDGAQGAQFLSAIARLIEEPLGLLDKM